MSGEPASTDAIDALLALARPEHRPGAARPFVTVSYAQTLDGRIATRTGDSRWVSGPDALRFAHCLRATHDAILVGVGTVLRDDPRLTTRLVPGPNPTRVVLDSRLRLPPDAAVLDPAAGAPALVVATEGAPDARRADLERRGARVLLARADPEGHVDLADALARLAALGIRSVQIEGGARVITAALRARVVDRLAVCVAPKVLGAGIEGVGDLGIARLADALCLRDLQVLRLGDDLLVVGVPC